MAERNEEEWAVKRLKQINDTVSPERSLLQVCVLHKQHARAHSSARVA